MIQSVWVINQNGEYLELPLRTSGENLGIYVFNLDGLGSPVASVSGTGGPGFDGTRVNSIQVDARSMKLSLVIPVPGEVEEDAKDLIYRYFPVTQTITFGIKTDRYNVSIPAVVEQNEFTQFSKIENAEISLYCPFPYFQDVLTTEIILDVSLATPLFSFPFSNESLTESLLEFGTINDLPTSIIQYSGIATGLLFDIIFDDTADLITITNNNGNQSMEIDLTLAEAYFGVPTGSGDRLTVNTKAGQKNVQFIKAGGGVYNLLNGVALFSDWIEIRPGTNRLIISADNGTGSLYTTILLNKLREGI